MDNPEISQLAYVELFTKPGGLVVLSDMIADAGFFNIDIREGVELERRNAMALMLTKIARGSNEPHKAAIKAFLETAATIRVEGD